MFLLCHLMCLLLTTVTLPLSIIGATVEVPILSITAYEPHGLKVNLPNADGISEFFFWGNVNEKLESWDIGNIKLLALEPTNEEWIAEDDSISLKTGDVINYTLFIKINGIMRRFGAMSYKVDKLVPHPALPSEGKKKPQCKSDNITITVKNDKVKLNGSTEIPVLHLNDVSAINVKDCEFEIELDNSNKLDITIYD